MKLNTKLIILGFSEILGAFGVSGSERFFPARLSDVGHLKGVSRYAVCD